MFQYILIILFLSVGLRATEVFSFAEEFPQVIMNGEQISNAFTGGLNKPKIQWLDHDEDGDIDLFLSDMDGHLRYYENRGNSSEHDFILRYSHFQHILPAGWFAFRDLDLDGDMDLARKLIDAAKESGADCVKFQSWTKDTIFSKKYPLSTTDQTNS